MRDMTIKLNVAASYKCAYSFLKINMQAVQKQRSPGSIYTGTIILVLSQSSLM
jgi:hypothetical protein